MSYTDGRITTLTTPIGNFTYTFDANGNLEYVHKPDTTTIQYIYDDPNDIHNLTGIIDETGARTLTVAYDTSDRVTNSAFAEEKEHLTIAYPSALERTITNSNNVTSTYQLEVKNGIVRVASFTGPGCSACGSDSGSAYVYDDRQQITRVTDARDNITTNIYDLWGNRTSKTEAVGTPEERTTGWTYIPGTDRVETITRPSVANPGQQAITTLGYDTPGNLLTRTETGFAGTTAISRITGYTYDSFGRIETIDGPRTDVNDVTTFTYYPNTSEQGSNRGNLHTVANALGHTTTYGNYNAFGKPRLITPPYGEPVVLAYDTSGRLQSKTRGTIVTSYEYYDDGKLHILHLPDNRNITYTYTPTGKPRAITDTLGNKITYTYDDLGQRTKMEIHDPHDVLQHFVEYTYEDTGDLDKTKQADGTYEDLDYDPVGNLIARINALGKTTEYRYDALNRLTSMIEPVSDTETATTGYAYDSNDGLATVTDAEGKPTIYTYDDFGRKVSQTSPDTGVTTYRYDPADNLIASTDANNVTTTSTYDALNRLVAVQYPDSSLNVIYTYDELNCYGELTTVQDSSGVSKYKYDMFARVREESRYFGSQLFITKYEYNNSSEVYRMTYPSGRRVEYRRDAAGRVTEVKSDGRTVANSIGYKPFGPMSSMRYGNGVTVSNTYNQLYRLTNTTAGSISNRDYTYYATGHVETVTDNYDPAASQSFTYDDLGRLQTAQGVYGLYNWVYDDVGNRTLQSADDGFTTYTIQPGSNRLVEASGAEDTSYSYDNNGNMTGMGATTLNWDQQNRLRSAVVAGQPAGQYGYDARNLRSVRVVDGATVYSLYDRTGNLLAEVDYRNGRKSTLREYVYLDGARLALHDYEYTVDPGGNLKLVTKKNYYFVSDHLSTAQQLLNDSGAVAWQGNYTPFGEVNVVVNNVTNLTRFPGQYFDAETGLHYNWNRYYDPSTGRYLSADPIGLDGGMNLYAYVGGNPINFTDPMGLWVSSFHYRMSYYGVKKECPKIARELADATAGVGDDKKNPGTQQPGQAYWHAMSDGTTFGNREHDIKEYNRLQENGKQSCKIEDIKFALHALQDKYATAHRGFAPWSKTEGEYLLHIGDNFWTEGADNASHSRYERRCPIS